LFTCVNMVLTCLVETDAGGRIRTCEPIRNGT
jgi:hypothetical protein